MIRWIALATVLGALSAGAGLFAAIESPSRTSIIAWFGAPKQTTRNETAAEDWPICTTMTAMASVEPDA
jgi:hypothetical protein